MSLDQYLVSSDSDSDSDNEVTKLVIDQTHHKIL
jgi:hypothetical protein